MVIYDSADIYIESATSLADKIKKIDAVIAALMVTAAKAAATDNITEYSLDNGQTKIRTVYNGAASVFRSIAAFEKLKNLYINQMQGRMVRLVDGKNFNNRRNGRC